MINNELTAFVVSIGIGILLLIHALVLARIERRVSELERNCLDLERIVADLVKPK